MITWVVIVVLLVGFFTMIIGINRGWWRGLDQWAFLHVTNQQDQRFWHQVAFWGQPWLTVAWIIAISLWWLLQGQWLLTTWTLGVLGIANIIGIITKKVVSRTRPVGHLPHDDDFSFPSGHVLGLTLLVNLLIFYWPSWWGVLLAILWWLLVASSRLVLRAHHLSDLIGTLCFAQAWFLICDKLLALVWLKF